MSIDPVDKDKVRTGNQYSEKEITGNSGDFKELVAKEIENNSNQLKELSLKIHANPEIGLQEIKTATLICQFLEQDLSLIHI